MADLWVPPFMIRGWSRKKAQHDCFLFIHSQGLQPQKKIRMLQLPSLLAYKKYKKKKKHASETLPPFPLDTHEYSQNSVHIFWLNFRFQHTSEGFRKIVATQDNGFQY